MKKCLTVPKIDNFWNCWTIFFGTVVLRHCWGSTTVPKMKKCSTVPKIDNFWHCWTLSFFSALLYFDTVVMPLVGCSTVRKYKSAENKFTKTKSDNLWADTSKPKKLWFYLKKFEVTPHPKQEWTTIALATAMKFVNSTRKISDVAFMPTILELNMPTIVELNMQQSFDLWKSNIPE